MQSLAMRILGLGKSGGTPETVTGSLDSGFCCALEIEFEKFGEEVVIRDVGGPAVGREDGLVEFFVGQVEPRGALVVEVGEGAFFEFFGARLVAGDGAWVFDRADP